MKRNLMRFQKAGGGEYKPELPKAAPATASDAARLQETYLANARKRASESRRDYFEDDEEDEFGQQQLPTLGGYGDDADEEGPGGDDVDPLDAFMQGIEQKVEEEKHTIGKTEMPEIVSGWDEGELEEYVSAAAAGRTAGDEGAEASDDEQFEYDSDGAVVGRVPASKKNIAPLAPVDHSTISYPPFRKDFYREHESVAALSEEEVGRLRQDLELTATGSNVPRPVRSFMESGLPSNLLREIAKVGFEAPTPIQAQAIPAALSGRDVIGIAKTGSGKTFSFVWPAIVHILDQPAMQAGDGPIVLILAPTRELVSQIYSEARKFCKPLGLEVVAIFGGAGKWEMKKALKNCPHIVVATPGRMIDMIKERATNLQRCTMVVLDEADRMFDMGFEYQMRSIVNNVRPDRQTLLFSATFKRKVEALAREILKDPVRLMIGSLGQANEDIHQVVEVLPDDRAKWSWLVERLDRFVAEGRLLIFVSSKQGSDQLAENLNKYTSHNCGAIHGDRDQSERTTILRKFKSGEVLILVATDVAARGLDVKDIKNVVNFDVAKNIETHIHRIGRTGRMGVEGVQPGTAYTLITHSESAAAIDLVRNLRVSKQEVPAELERLAQSNPRYHAAMNPRREKHTHGLGFGGQSHPQMTSFMASQESSAADGGSSSKRAFDHAGGKEASQAPRRSRFSDGSSLAAAPAAAAARPALKGFVPATHTAPSFGGGPASQAAQEQQQDRGRQQTHSVGSGSVGAEAAAPRRKSRWDS